MSYNLTSAMSYLAAGDEPGFVSEMQGLRDNLRNRFQGKLLEIVKNFIGSLWQEYSNDPSKLYDIIRQLLGGWITLPEIPPATTAAGASALAVSESTLANRAQSLTDEVMGAADGTVEAAAIDATWIAAIIKIIIEILLKKLAAPAPEVPPAA